jgi:hypothetical protein
MATRANYAHIGLFVVLAVFGTVGFAVWLGTRTAHRDTIAFFTYFNESVQGLDAGAQVSFRGVKIGDVGGITIAPDGRRVEVKLNIDVGSMERLGFWRKGSRKNELEMSPPPPDLRTQLSGQGLTGSKFIAIDFFDPKTNPPPELPFPVPKHYLPATKSFSKGLEDSIESAMDSLTQLSERSLIVLKRVDRLTEALERDQTGEEAADAVHEADTVLRDLDRTLTSVDRAGLAQGMGATLVELRNQMNKFGSVVDRLDGDSGLVAAAKFSAISLGKVGQTLTSGTGRLDETLAEIRQAAAAVRVLAEEIERQPDALVKGRAAGQPR